MKRPVFSVVMPSFLGHYKGAAKDRDQKILRAIESVRAQSFDSWELIVIADGCQKTFDIVNSTYRDDPRIECLLIEKQTTWSGGPRNCGHAHARGEWVTYLDIDDKLGPDHLLKIAEGIQAGSSQPFEWLFYNDYITVAERRCTPTKGNCGTSNITFRRDLPVQWRDSSYLHDWRFIQGLLKYPYKKIPTPEYHVMHIPGRVDL